MKKLIYLLCLSMLFAGCLAHGVMPEGDDSGAILDSGSDVRDSGADVKDSAIDVKNPDAGLNFDIWPPSSIDITYHNGPVLTDPVPVYLIWYGKWDNSATVPLVEDLVNGLSESPYFSTTSTYYEMVPIDVGYNPSILGKVYATDKISSVKSVFVGYTNGTSLSDADVFTVVSDAINSHLVPASSSAIYLVLTSADVQEGNLFSGFCSGYCGWHNHKVLNSVDVKYGFIGDPTNCLDGCSAKTKYDEYGITHSPNNNWGADSMASVVAHELTEAITDPIWDTSPGWVDVVGYENADKCAWNYGDVYLTNDYSVANVKLGTREFLLQQNWLLDEDAGQHCALHP